MGEKDYSVSEAVRLVGVESHVLRYWEEELQVEIRRTSQGHRIYSQKNIETFRRTRELKEHGLQLKAIRFLLDEANGTLAKAELTEQISGIGSFEESDAKQQEQQETEAAADSGSGAEKNAGEARDAAAGAEPAPRCEDLETGDLKEEDPEHSESEPAAEICQMALAERSPESLLQFEAILRQLIAEAAEEQNRKLEQELREMIRGELEQLFFRYEEMRQEAAAAREAEIWDQEPEPFGWNEREQDAGGWNARGQRTQMEKGGVIDRLRRLLRR